MRITNLLPAQPRTNGWVTNGHATASDTQYGYQLQYNGEADDGYADYGIPCLGNTEYVCNIQLVRMDSPGSPDGPFFAYEMDSNRSVVAVHKVMGAWPNGQHIVTQPNASILTVRVYAPHGKSGDISVWRWAGIYTAQDFAALQSLGLNYFDGGTMPLAS